MNTCTRSASTANAYMTVARRWSDLKEMQPATNLYDAVRALRSIERDEREARDADIVRRLEDGDDPEDIADDVGLSKTRVLQIGRDATRRTARRQAELVRKV